jgi:flagellar basal body-associated protein FliL
MSFKDLGIILIILVIVFIFIYFYIQYSKRNNVKEDHQKTNDSTEANEKPLSQLVEEIENKQKTFFNNQ